MLSGAQARAVTMLDAEACAPKDHAQAKSQSTRQQAFLFRKEGSSGPFTVFWMRTYSNKMFIVYIH